LLACICPTEAEYKRFRQLVVNAVMATDIFDKELLEFRNKRWDKAFHGGADDSSSEKETMDRKATIVIEHIIQAADVSHTMQHWHVYTKWNERLFAEMYTAYKNGKSDKDPSEGWYNGEIWFFDNYVIPLAKKLADCGVFGVCSAECLNYAMENRKEWERKGHRIVEQMKNKYKDSETSDIRALSRDSSAASCSLVDQTDSTSSIEAGKLSDDIVSTPGRFARISSTGQIARAG
jgi:hypothetical protein